MTNREKLLEKLSKMDNHDLAYVLCASQRGDCDDCIARSVCRGSHKVVEWLGKEEKDDLAD